MKQGENFAGFPPVSSEIESFQQELRNAFRFARPALMGIAAFCLVQASYMALLR